eukprot:TRINITY_DN34778_c0_g1_i2.p3 TRINITY_DN34778_c0_g1~~TRINITY_DN34778_c0_g1_i2.p3  ORF type:complete len:103 (-),score=1.24 TRINITY_DN34778_c0_g1_i2:169-477(-)
MATNENNTNSIDLTKKIIKKFLYIFQYLLRTANTMLKILQNTRKKKIKKANPKHKVLQKNITIYFLTTTSELRKKLYFYVKYRQLNIKINITQVQKSTQLNW